MHVEHLLDDQSLGLRPVWAEPGLLGREISGVTVTDLEDPGRFVRAGEAVLSGLVWWTPDGGEEKADRFVRALRRVDAAVLLAGEETHGSVPEELVAACVRHRLPLAGVPRHVMFRAVTETVYLQQWGELSRHHALPDHLRARLGGLLAQGAGPQEILAAAFAQPRAGTAAAVRTAAGRTVAATPGADAPAPPRAGAGGAGAAGGTSIPVEAGVASPYERWSLHLPEPDAAPPRLLQEVAAVLGRCQEAYIRRETAAREAADGLGALLVDAGGERRSGAATGVERELRACGLPAEGPYRVFAVRTGSRRAGWAVGALAEVLAWTGGGPAALGRLPGGTAFAVVPRSAPPEEFVRVWPLVAGGVPGEPLHGGTGVPAADPGGLAAALAEARYALACARSAAPGAALLTDAAALGSLDALLGGVPARVRATYSRTVLGPLAEPRNASAAALLETLRTFLACDGSWARAAEALHLHVNTVHYRVQRIEHLTGRTLSRLTDRLDLRAALLCRDAGGGDSGGERGPGAQDV
ncbi:PucR family transcriptional regulator [Streptomyces sp. NPDC049813]|uniref:PucR family transcriptional regulator n=1 Tax=Streptomyces sp. NPDC049813 TaxID=3365597 RepID=UPI0037B1A807